MYNSFWEGLVVPQFDSNMERTIYPDPHIFVPLNVPSCYIKVANHDLEEKGYVLVRSALPWISSNNKNLRANATFLRQGCSNDVVEKENAEYLILRKNDNNVVYVEGIPVIFYPTWLDAWASSTDEALEFLNR